MFIEGNALASEVDGVGALPGTVPDGAIVCLVVVFACRDFLSENGRLIWVQTGISRRERLQHWHALPRHTGTDGRVIVWVVTKVNNENGGCWLVCIGILRD